MKLTAETKINYNKLRASVISIIFLVAIFLGLGLMLWKVDRKIDSVTAAVRSDFNDTLAELKAANDKGGRYTLKDGKFVFATIAPDVKGQDLEQIMKNVYGDSDTEFREWVLDWLK